MFSEIVVTVLANYVPMAVCCVSYRLFAFSPEYSFGEGFTPKDPGLRYDFSRVAFPVVPILWT